MKIKRNLEIINLQKKGWSLKQLSDKFQVSRERVRQILELMKAAPKPVGKRILLSPEDKTTIKSLYLDGGCTVREISALYGGCEKTIEAILDRFDVKRSPTYRMQRRADGFLKEMIKDYKNGCRVYDIARKYNMDHRNVSKYLKNAGLHISKGCKHTYSKEG